MTSGGTRAKPVGKVVDLGVQPVAGNDPIHQADPMRFSRIDQVTGHEQLARLLLPDEERHEEGDRCRAEPDLGFPELGIVGRDDEVAGHRQFETPGQGIAMNLGDHRFRA